MFDFLDGDTRDTRSFNNPPLAHPFATVGQVQRAAVWIELPGKEPVKIEANEGYCLPPDLPYGYSVRAPGGARFIWAHVNFRIFDSLDLFHFLKCPIRFTPKVGRTLADINRRLHAFKRDRPLSLKSMAEKKVLGFRLLVLLLSSADPSFRGVEELVHVRRLLPVLTFVRTHLAARISRKTLADRVFLSETHFHTYFKSAMRMAPMEYVQLQRMQKAQQLLVQTTESIAQVAAQVGFDDQFYFSRQFRAFVSMSPTEYRQRRKQTIW